MQREAIFAALFDRLKGAAPWKTADRHRQHWSQVPDQPALFVIEGDEETPEGQFNRPRLIKIGAEIWIYSQHPNPPSVSLELNDLIDAVRLALLPAEPFRQPQTLGLEGVVHCGIEGRALIYPGDLGSQGFAMIPVVVRVAESALIDPRI